MGWILKQKKVIQLFSELSHIWQSASVDQYIRKKERKVERKEASKQARKQDSNISELIAASLQLGKEGKWSSSVLQVSRRLLERH